jgi:anti-anti-sigma factor
MFEEHQMPQATRSPWLYLEVSVEDQGTTRTISPRGEMDLGSAGFVAKPLLHAMSNGFERVVLDLSETTFIDSVGLAVVVGATARADEEGIGFVVIPGPDEIQGVFDLCGYTELVPFVANGSKI